MVFLLVGVGVEWVVEGREGERSVRVECEWREWGWWESGGVLEGIFLMLFSGWSTICRRPKKHDGGFWRSKWGLGWKSWEPPMGRYPDRWKIARMEASWSWGTPFGKLRGGIPKPVMLFLSTAVPFRAIVCESVGFKFYTNPNHGWALSKTEIACHDSFIIMTGPDVRNILV